MSMIISDRSTVRTVAKIADPEPSMVSSICRSESYSTLAGFVWVLTRGMERGAWTWRCCAGPNRRVGCHCNKKAQAAYVVAALAAVDAHKPRPAMGSLAREDTQGQDASFRPCLRRTPSSAQHSSGSRRAKPRARGPCPMQSSFFFTSNGSGKVHVLALRCRFQAQRLRALPDPRSASPRLVSEFRSRSVEISFRSFADLPNSSYK